MPTKPTVSVVTPFGHIQAWKHDVITEQLERYGAHTRNEIAMLGSLLQPGDTVLDVGAHIGTFSIAFAKLLGDGGQVYSFEADTDNFQLLDENIRNNRYCSVVHPVNAVVSDREQRFRKVTPDPNNSGMHYFVPEDAKTPSDQNSLSLDQWSEGIGLQACALLKVDVEGAEVSVLRSAQNILQIFRPLVYIEVNQAALAEFGSTVDDIEELLDTLGYSYFRNVGQRNSSHDRFRIARLPRMRDGGHFFDCLAIPHAHPSTPSRAKTQLNFQLWKVRRLLRHLRAQARSRT